MVALFHDVPTLLLFVHTVGSKIRGAFISTGLTVKKNLHHDKAQLLDILFLHFGQDLFGFRLRDDHDFEFPHTIPQLEAGSLFPVNLFSAWLTSLLLLSKSNTSQCQAAHMS